VGPIPGQGFHQGKTVGQGHVPIRQHQGIGLFPTAGLGQLHQSIPPVGQGGDGHAPMAQGVFQSLPGSRVVIHQQQGRPRQGGESGTSPGQGFQTGGAVENTALPHFAFHPQPSPHEPGQPGADGQPQAGAAEAPGNRAVGLGKGVENQGLLVRRNADAGVRHGEMETIRLLPVRGHGNPDMAPVGKFDGIAHQIEEHLAQAPRIAPVLFPQGRVQVRHQFQAPIFGPQGLKLQGIHDQGTEGEGDFFHLHLARLDLGKIQDVVDDADEMLGRVVYGA